MKHASTLRMTLLVICAASIANQLVLYPLFSGWGPPISVVLKDFFGIDLVSNLRADTQLIPEVVRVAVNYLQIAGVVLALRGGRGSTPAPVAMQQWGVAAQPPSYSPPPPPPPSL